VSALPGVWSERAISWFHDLLSALRANLAAPAYSLPAVVSVLLGVGAATTIFSVFSAVSLRPLPFANEERLVCLFDHRHLPGLEKTVISPLELRDYARLNATLESLAAYAQTEATVTHIGEPKHINLVRVTPNFFHTLGLQPAIGRGFDPENTSVESDTVVLVSHAFWMSALGGGTVIGRGLTVDDRVRTIIGVLGPDQAMPALGDVWVPLKWTAQESTQRSYRMLSGVGRLKDGVTLEMARADLERVSLAVNPPAGGARAVLTPLREELLGNNQKLAEFMLAAVGVFLLLSCANVASLLLTRASARTHELAVRRALGASPGRLRREAMLEAFVIVAVGAVLGALLARTALAVIGDVYADLLAYAKPTLDARVLGFFIVLSLSTSVGIGSLSAWRASGVSPMDSLRSGARVSGGKLTRRLRELLVAAQVAASLSLLIAASVLIRSGLELTRVAPGFSVEGVVSGQLSLPEQSYDDDRTRQFVDISLASLRAIPGQRAVAMASQLPLGGVYASHVLIDAQAPRDDLAFAEERHVSPGYFDALGVTLLGGRDFTARDRAGGVPVAIVNRSFATRLTSSDGAIGRRFSSRRDASGEPIWFEIVGVVDDIRDFGLDQPFRPTFFLPLAQAPVPNLAVIVRADTDSAELMMEVRRRIGSIDANLPLYGFGTLESTLAASYAPRTVLTALLITIALGALLLASIGLFGVTSDSIYQRVHEFGIRRAIGASRNDIFRLVLGETSVLVLLGMAAGGSGAWAARRLVSSWLFGISVADVPSWSLAALITFGVSLLAVVPPARAAATVSPMVSLKAG
jgi:putative ABC transport system permease protein